MAQDINYSPEQHDSISGNLTLDSLAKMYDSLKLIEKPKFDTIICHPDCSELIKNQMKELFNIKIMPTKMTVFGIKIITRKVMPDNIIIFSKDNEIIDIHQIEG